LAALREILCFQRGGRDKLQEETQGGHVPASDEELKKALKAFKKRIKLTQLEEDSRLGHSPLTGSKTKIVCIQPPRGFPAEIWQELADRGHLRHDGGGFYEMTNKPMP
jgi:hypothetical protein